MLAPWRNLDLLVYLIVILFFTKVLTNRIAKIASRLITNCQSAFIRGRFILESVVTAHEAIHDVHSRKEKGLVLKIDYEKAYDKVNLDFFIWDFEN